MIKIFLVLMAQLMGGPPGEQARYEMPSVEACVANVGGKLSEVATLDQKDGYTYFAMCVVEKPGVRQS